jgi:hypothetical protein
MKKETGLKTNENRGVFIDNIQGWFYKRNMFWTAITFIALSAIIILQLSFTFLTGINPNIRLLIYPILVPLLLLFIFSIFWRNTITAFLSLAGALCLFVGMYYAYVSQYLHQTISSSASQASNVGKHFPPLDVVGTFYSLWDYSLHFFVLELHLNHLFLELEEPWLDYRILYGV